MQAPLQHLDHSQMKTQDQVVSGELAVAGSDAAEALEVVEYRLHCASVHTPGISEQGDNLNGTRIRTDHYSSAALHEGPGVASVKLV